MRIAPEIRCPFAEIYIAACVNAVGINKARIGHTEVIAKMPIFAVTVNRNSYGASGRGEFISNFSLVGIVYGTVLYIIASVNNCRTVYHKTSQAVAEILIIHRKCILCVWGNSSSIGHIAVICSFYIIHNIYSVIRLLIRESGNKEIL